MLPRCATIWEGFVLVNLSGDALEAAGAMAGLSHELAPWRWSEMVTVASKPFPSTWNWKVMVENWIECYHPGNPSRVGRAVSTVANARIVDSAGGRGRR